MMKRTTALLTLGALLVLALVAPTLASSDTGYIFDSQYKVSKDGSAKISHLIIAKNGSADKTPEALMISVAGTNVHAISAVLNDDKNLSAVLSDDGASTVSYTHLTLPT